MKNLLILFLFSLVAITACEPERDDLSDMVQRVSSGEAVFIESESDDLSVVGAVPIGIITSALLTCPALGLPSPEYDWLCCIEGSRGVALGTDDELKIYVQSPSLQYPSPITSKLYFSTNWYPLYAWTDDDCEDLEDDVDAWPGPGPGYENWNDQIEQWCGIDYPELCCPDE